ncbi:hypothetical protein AVEN_186767-1, partial [Araneus ventricosus]
YKRAILGRKLVILNRCQITRTTPEPLPPHFRTTPVEGRLTLDRFHLYLAPILPCNRVSNLRPSGHETNQWFGVPSLKYASSSVVGPPRTDACGNVVCMRPGYGATGRIPAVSEPPNDASVSPKN